MFGFITARADTLSPAELARYEACYCGLCRCLEKQYGGWCRMALNYDMTFLILLLSSLYEPEETAGTARCAAHPMKARPFWKTAFTEYAAHLTVLLTRYKLWDDWQDDSSAPKKKLAEAMDGPFEKAKAALPRQQALIQRELEALAALEREREPVPDKCAAAFGRLMAGLLAPREDRWQETLEQAGFFLGEFIYLQDACVDLKKDARRGRFNPLLAMDGGTVRPLREFQPMLLMVAGQCVAAADRLPLVQDAGIVRNVLYEGMWTRYHQALSREEGRKKANEEGSGSL